MTNAELFTSKTAAPKSVAIVGGGIAAVCLADQIYKVAPSTQVTIYCEDKTLANRGSGNKQGAIYPLLQGSKSVIAEVYATCFTYALDYYSELLEQGLEVEHGFTGVLQQAIKPELEPRLKKVAQTWPELCQYISAQDSSEIAGISLPYPSIFFKQGGWIWPQQFCQALAHKLQLEFGLTIALNHKVDNIEKSGSWQLNFNNKSVTAHFDAVVICNGHKANQFDLSAHIPLQSVRGQVSRLHANTQLAQLKTVLCHKGYITPAQSEYQCFGATFIKDDNDESVREAEQEANFNQLNNVYQEPWTQSLKPSDVIADKAAIRAMSPDHIPIVGELFSDNWMTANVDKNNGRLKRLKAPATSHPNSDIQGLYIQTGLGARGLTSSPLLSKHLAHVMFGLDSPLNERMVKAISAKRFQIRELKKNKSQR